MSDMRLKVVLTGDGRQLTGTLKTAQGEVQQFSQSSVQAGTTSAQAFSKTRAGVESISNQLQVARQQLVAFIGVHQALSAGQQMVRTVAAYQDAQTQLQGLTTSAADYAQQEQYLIDLGDRHHKNILTLTSSYSRLLTLQNAGLMTQAEGRDILEGLSNAASQLGASNAQLEQSMYGLAQGLSSGILRAEELNQVTEPLPGLLQELDKAAGLGAGGFRQLVNAGAVTSAMFRDTLITALAAYDGAAERTASNLTAKFTDVQNSYLLLARELQQPLTDGLGPLLDGMSSSLKWTAENAELLGGILQGVLVVGAARATVAIGSMASAKMADLTVSRQSAAAELQLAQAQVASTAAALRNAQAQTGLIAGHGTAAKAADAHAASLVRLQAAQQNVGSVGRSLLGLLGGPVGLVVTAGLTAAAFIDWGSSAAHAADGTNALTRSVDELTAAQARQRINNLKDDYDAAQKQVQRFERQLQELAEQYPNMYPSERNMREFNRALDDARGNLDTAKQAAEDYSNQIQTLEGHIESLSSTAKTPVNAPAQVDPEQEKAITQMTDRLIDQIHQLQLGERAYLDYQLAQQNATAGQRAQALAAFDASKALKEKIKADEEAAAKAATHATTVKDFADGVLDSLDPLREIEQQMELVWAAFDAGHLDSDQVAAYVEHLKKKLKELDDVKVDPLKDAGKGMGEMASGINSIAGAMQGMYEEGDRGYKNMAVAMQAANVIAAVGAVLTQGMGDPYTAFARMAAMAASVAALGYSVGSVGGSAPDDAARRQAQQGTGTVFGDTAAKSESIANAVEITADASRELVGINRDMLKALQETQRGITGASNRIVTNTQNLSYDYGGGMTAVPTPKNIFDKASDLFGGGYGLLGLDRITAGIFKLGAKLLGGESEVTDQGVELIGGTMAEMIENTMMRGYETTRSKKWRWGSWKESTGYADIGEEPGQQVQAVFKSIADSVYAGATDLGLAGVDVQAAINSFAIDTQKISLKGLTAEEQQRELEAVFSSIFDRLAGHVISSVTHPLAKAGEGLGETLARVGANVNVTREAAYRLGFQLHHAAGAISEVSVKMVEAAGGMEQFISSMSGFVDKFAPDAHKFYLASTDMQRALSAVGLTVPSTRDEFWQLMQTLNAGTDAGRQQIATLLRLSSTADSYYKQLDEQQAAAQQAFMQAVTDAMGGYFADLASWAAEEQRAIEQDYRARISMLERQSQLSTQIGDYVAQLRLSDLSPAAPAEKLAAAGDEFAALLVRAQAGDLDAASKLQGAADTYLQNADAYYGRTDIYTSVFEDVATQLEQLGIGLGATSTEEHIASLNEQMLSEQQQVRAYLEQELDWAVSQYNKLTDIEQLLSILPSGISSSLQQLMQNPEQPITVAPIRPDGSHFNGLKRVPFDGYIAELHKDEAVLTAAENRALSRFDLSPLQSELAALRQEVAQLRAERARDAAKAEQQRNSQTDATETLVRVNRTPVKMT